MSIRRPGSRLERLPVVEALDGEAFVASTFRSRLLGLACLDLENAGPLLIPRCSSVHTFGMRFALDLCFLDESGSLVAVRRAVPPRRIAICGRASAVLEIPAGEGGEIAAPTP
jgi:uncharacterized protein